MTPPARLAVDIQALQVDGLAGRGIGRYTAAITTALAATGRVSAALLAPELPPPVQLPPQLVTAGLVAWDGRATLRRLLSEGAPVVHHVTAPFAHVGPTDPSVLVTAPHWEASGCPRVTTLYDLIPLRAPSHYLSRPGSEERYRLRARWVAGSDLLLTISDHTRSEALELLGCEPARVVSVGAGVSRWWSPGDGTDDAHFATLLPRWVDRPFVVCVAGSDTRKNTERLIAALGLLTRRGHDVGLVVAGHLTPDWVGRLSAAASAAGVASRVQLAGEVSDELLRACYRRAVVTVMPSLAEGSGLPVLESAACGTPAAASSTTSLAEVAATAEATFDPSDVDSIAGTVEALLDDADRRARVTAAQAALAAASGWDAVAARVVAAVDSLGLDDAPALPRPSWLLCGPVVPEGGGVGAYDTRLIDAAADEVDVTVVVDRPLPDPLAGRCRRVHPDAVGLDVRPVSHDAVIYPLGNSAGHLDTVVTALRHPGWLWLHEVRLPALATCAFEHLDDEEFGRALRHLLERAYPGRSPWASASRAGRSAAALADAGVGLAGMLATRSTGVLVNSDAARRLLLVDLPPGVAPPPIHVLPPMCPPVAVTTQPSGGGGGGLVSFGIVSTPKQPDLLVDAAAILGCPLHFVGPCPPVLRQLVTERAERLGIGDAVHVVGEVERAGWDEWLTRATVAVQLRTGSGGETSAAVLDALAAGTPVASSLLSSADWPDDVVARVDTSSAAALAADLGELLGSGTRRRQLSAAGLDFARSHGADALVAALRRVLDT